MVLLGVSVLLSSSSDTAGTTRGWGHPGTRTVSRSSRGDGWDGGTAEPAAVTRHQSPGGFSSWPKTSLRARVSAQPPPAAQGWAPPGTGRCSRPAPTAGTPGRLPGGRCSLAFPGCSQPEISSSLSSGKCWLPRCSQAGGVYFLRVMYCRPIVLLAFFTRFLDSVLGTRGQRCHPRRQGQEHTRPRRSLSHGRGLTCHLPAPWPGGSPSTHHSQGIWGVWG